VGSTLSRLPPSGCFLSPLRVPPRVDPSGLGHATTIHSSVQGPPGFRNTNTTIRVLLSLAASYGLLVHQMDVKTTFLNGELDEEIYMEQSDGFVVKGQESKVCKLLKSLYGLKQAPKQWHEKFDTTLTSTGFAINEADRCVYYRCGGGEGVILCLYVDDILIFGTNIDVINEVKSFLSKSFDMKDLGGS
jgi:hypothetical protein